MSSLEVVIILLHFDKYTKILWFQATDERFNFEVLSNPKLHHKLEYRWMCLVCVTRQVISKILWTAAYKCSVLYDTVLVIKREASNTKILSEIWSDTKTM